MSVLVVDTNVAVVANGRDTHASAKCQFRCIEKLEELKKYNIVAIDDSNHILDEYHKELNFSGQPNVGDVFYKYVFDNQYNQQSVHRVSIQRSASGSFNEFPDDVALAGFDNDDHMFVAVAIKHPNSPTILNAVDTDWANFNIALRTHGLNIEYLCPEHVNP